MPIQIHQLVHTLSYGDAISGEVLGLQRCFHEAGIESDIFAINVHPTYKGRAKDYRTFPKASPSTIGAPNRVILHYSLGSPLNELYRSLDAYKRVLIYHNITPPSWFSGVNPRIVIDIERGLAELPDLCARSTSIIADSEFNATELHKIGFKPEVLGLPIDPTRWAEPANQGIAGLIRSEPGLHLLHVGRIAPNKCIEDIIKTFHFIRYHVHPESYLWLVGIDIDTEIYSFALKRLARELEVDMAVRFVGGMADSEIRALYENCSAYMCMSEHEGFCLPVIEAMHFGLPVIAYASSALPQTLGAGGILVREKRHAELAQLVGELYRNQEMRKAVVSSGHQRVQEFGFENFRRDVHRHFLSAEG